jgi:hypothetical protein
MAMLFLTIQNGHHHGIHRGFHAVAGGTGAGDQQDTISGAGTYLICGYQLLCAGANHQKGVT